MILFECNKRNCLIKGEIVKSKRQIKILDYINEKGSSSVTELIDIFSISKATLNRDLTELENEGYVRKIHGGVISKRTMLTFEPLQREKESVESEYKVIIAREAIKEIKDGSINILDSGSTSLALAIEISQQKHFENLTIATNDLKVAMALADVDFVKLIVLGGQQRNGLYSLIGPLTMKALDSINADVFFFCIDALDFDRGISNANFDEIGVKQQMLKSAKKTILLADHSKFNKSRLAKICDFSEVNKIITDFRINRKEIEKLDLLVDEIIIAK